MTKSSLPQFSSPYLSRAPTSAAPARTHPSAAIPASAAVNKSANAEEQFGNSAHAFPLTPFFTPSSNLASFQPGPVTPPRLKEGMNHLNQSGGAAAPSRLQNHFFLLLLLLPSLPCARRTRGVIMMFRSGQISPPSPARSLQIQS